MAKWSDQLFQTLQGEQALEGRYSDKAKERTFHHGLNCHRQFTLRPNICPQSVPVSHLDSLGSRDGSIYAPLEIETTAKTWS
jgi:hypothetical protein